MTEIEQPPQNGIDLTTDDDENSKARPADIEQDMREMERRKRVEAIMGSKLFREELERIVDTAREGGASGILQQLSDIVGLPSARVGNVFKASNCMLPINDIRGVESMGYAKGEKILRCKLAATFRLLDLYGWTQGLGAQVTARLKVDQEVFLVNPYGMLYHEITASSLNKVDMQGQVVEQGTTNFGVNKNHFILHSIVHAARPDIRCAIYIGCSPVVAVSSLKTGLLPLTRDACVLGEITTHAYTGSLIETEERDKLVRNLGPNSKVMLLSNHGALCCGESIEEAFFAACHIVQACETQLRLLPVGVDNLVLIPEESRKTIYEQARRPPEDLEKKFAAALANTEKNQTATGDGEDVKDDAAAVKTVAASQKAPNWRVGGAEFEALMRMLDNAGYRTGYIYRHPLVKSELPKPKNDVELPPAVSSLGYLLEEEELYRQGIWKKGDLRKGGDRCRWLNSPNVYQKVEVLETGTPDPKKITKWVAEGSPTHGTPVRIEDPLQFVPAGTNPKEFKRVQQQIKDNRRADKISAGPQSHILEGVTWDEANRIKDATVSSAGDHVVLMGAASKGIIQRGFQHNATVYKTPYAKNPFDNVTDDELNEYKRTVERKKKSIHGEYTDTDFSETEALSSVHASAGATLMKHTVAAVSQSEPEDTSEHQVMRIETQQAPVPSQPEVILSDDSEQVLQIEPNQKSQDHVLIDAAGNKENIFAGNQNISRNKELIAELKNDLLFQRQKEKLVASPTKANDGSFLRKSTKTDKKTKEPFPGKDNSNVATFTTSKNIPIQSNQNNDKIITETSSNKANENNNNITSDAITQNSNNELIIPSSCQKLGPFSNPTPPNSSNYYYEMMFASSELPTYDTARSNDYKSAFESADSDRLYTKSLFCYTPNVCDSVFESLQRPLDNDLILNIPFTIPIQPPTSATSTPRKQQPLPSDIQQSDSLTPTSPYRTLSHFGFNSPNSTPQPEHKHIPRQLTTKYVPLTKSTSYEEIFSSPRYVDLCENCFEKIVRLKPELVYIKTRLRNLVDFNGSNKVEGIEAVGCGSTETTETLPAFPAALEPVIEESSEEGSDGRLKSLEKSISNSTFIEKITRMNYSEESANVNFLNTPRTVSSNISLEGETDQQEHKELKDIEEHLTTEMQQLKLNVESRDELSQCGSVTEIWEFGNWQDQQPLVTDADDVNVDADRTLTAKHNSTGSNESRRSKRRRFMSREERNQRKHEFQELWEDHITFFNNKDETLSDTESAIDETTGNAIRVQAQQMEQSREVFHGRSMVTKRLFSDPLEDEHPGNEVDAWIQLKNMEDVEVVDDCRFKYSLNVEECEELNAEVVKSSDAGQLMTLNYNKEDNELDNEEVSEGSHDTRLRQLHFHSDAEDEVAKLSNEEMEMAESSDGCTSTRTFNVHNSKEQLIFRDDVANDACNGDGFNMHVLENKSPFELNDNVGLKYSPRAEEFILFDQNPDDFPKLATEMETNIDPLSCSDNETSARTKLTELNNNEYKEFNSLERIILEKIEINQLKESEVIFDKIENTIRNKLTPSKIEELLQKQKKLLIDGLAGTTNSQFSSSTPSKIATLKHGSEEDGSFSSLNLSRIFEEDTAHDNDDSPSAHLNLLSCSLNCEKHISNHQNCLSLPNPIDKFQTFQDLTKTYQSDFMRFRRSRSLTLCNKKVLENKKSPPLSQNQISVTLAEPQTTRSSPEIRTKFGKPSPAYKRNFVLENIRNASIPRNVKRLQRSNTNAIFLKNPFGATSSVTPVTSTGTSNQSTKESDVVSTDVYAFQTKLVRGSPRFWVSMSQTPAKKLQNTKNLQMRRKKPHSKLHASSSSISTGTFTDLETPSTSASYIRTKVDVDLAALSLEIEDVKPHLERYKRKLDDYGEHVAKCARNMEECIEVQLDIQEEHKKLRDDILLNQYIEEISCNVQTFSISETED